MRNVSQDLRPGSASIDATRSTPTLQVFADLFDLIHLLVQDLIKQREHDGMSKGVADRLKSDLRTLQLDPRTAVAKLTQDLVGAEEANASLIRILDASVGKQIWPQRFTLPSVPRLDAIVEDWTFCDTN